MKHDLISRIEKAMPELSKSQRAIGNYIIANYDKSAYLTASKLGAAVGVSESTVVRFAIELGYDGYPALQHALRELIRTRLTSVQRMEITNKRIGENSVLSTVLRSDMDKIKETLETVDPAAFEGAVDTLLGARTIYVMGVRMTGSLASFLTFGLSMIFPNVKQIQTSSGGEIFEQLLRVGEGDVIIPITFPRYSKRIGKLVLFCTRQRNDKGIDNAERRNERVDKRSHIRTGCQQIVCELRDRRDIAVGERYDLCAVAAGIFYPAHDTL